MSERSVDTTLPQLTLFAEDSPAKTSAWLETVLAWLGTAAAFGTSSIASLLSSVPVGWSPTECERLQGFPDGWTEGLSDSARYWMLGNAVCVPVGEWIARRIVNAA